MKISLLFVGATVAIAAFALVLQSTGLIQGHVDALQKAPGVSARLTSSTVGVGRLQYSVDLARPNLLRVETPTATYISDGTNFTTYLRQRNVFAVEPVSPKLLREALSFPETLPFAAFFDARAFAGATSIRDAGTVTRRGMELRGVRASLSAGKVATFYMSTTDGVARQFEFGDGKNADTIVDVMSLNLARPSDSTFAFKAPAGAKQIEKSDLTEVRWFTNFPDALAEAKSSNRMVMVDFWQPGCGPCEMLKTMVFNQDAFKAQSDRFVFCSINIREDRSMLEEFPIEGTPTIMFFRNDGTRVGMFVGFRPVDQFVEEMNRVSGR